MVLIFACYALARLLEVFPAGLPRISIVALDVLSAMAFALLDGARRYRWRGILVFAAICIVIGNVIENIGVATGVPFGRYEFIELMGPNLFKVPLLLGLAYIGMAYVSWRLAGIILGNAIVSVRRSRMVARPAVAAFIMVAWDLAQDPVWSTVLRGWTWRDGGAWFGVPVSNYFGWYVTVFSIYLAFSIYLHRRPIAALHAETVSQWPPLLFYALCIIGNVLQICAHPAAATVQDPAGRTWQVAGITAASALVSIFVMGAFALVAAIRILEEPV